ncbi:MAG TPA: hypothetical protein VJA23_04535 [Candidatus Nanoarchaeia archaeon]|nr:hypothetical protein [Candidatus Nanoarchaeia archaeon]
MLSFPEQVEIMITRGFGYKTYYSRTERELDLLALHQHLGRMEIESNRYDQSRTRAEIDSINTDLSLMSELAQSRERKTDHSSAELYPEIDQLKNREEKKDRPEITDLATFLR